MSDAAAYLRVRTLQDALDALVEQPWVVAAGCTDLFPATERKRLPQDVLDITAIPELRGIQPGDREMRIGATTTWTDILKADLPAAFDGLKLAAREVGARQIQNRGTLAGNLCNASPAADGVPPLLTLDADVELASVSGTRRVPLASFLTGPRATMRRADELVTAVLVPKAALTGQANFLKLGARDHLVISIAMTSVRLVLENGVIQQAAVAIGACGPVATRLPDVETALIGQQPHIANVDADAVASAIAPIDDVRGTAGYRNQAAVEMVQRCIRSVADPQVQAA